MKKSKRLISLILAVVMVLSFMAMSASAATTEVQPRGTCPQCINGYVETVYGAYNSSKPDGIYHSCPNIGVGHEHYIRHFPNAKTVCRNCGFTYKFPNGLNREYCPYNSYVY